MALYAFDGTWNSDEDKLKDHTNVVRFAELYNGNTTEYVSGVGTRFGKLGHVLGGLFGSGGRCRIDEMYDEEKHLFLIGDGKKPCQIKKSADPYLFANDMPYRYDNNEGSLAVTVKRTA